MELKFETKVNDALAVSPLHYLIHFRSLRQKKDIHFEYGIYENFEKGSGLTKQRDIHHTQDLKKFYNHFEANIVKLPDNRELSIHSKVSIEKKKYHIPLIDFSFSSEDNIELLKNAIFKLQKDFNYDIYIFKSGRSFHGYLDALLSQEDWMRFLGKLILLNRERQIIDFLWVGHSAAQGFSSLRLSHNTDWYEDYPSFYALIPKSSYVAGPNLSPSEIPLSNNFPITHRIPVASDDISLFMLTALTLFPFFTMRTRLFIYSIVRKIKSIPGSMVPGHNGNAELK